ncbi:MAG TPA: M56 family metallopeptidase [Vicinamibacterales bacterium]|nr:M56 family metallopeptidase [Vicinamibacterales bacterium]
MFDPSTVATVVLKTSLLVAAIGLVAGFIARHSAAWRHFLWTSALALSLLMPVAVVYLPAGVQVSLPWEAAEPWLRDQPSPALADIRRDGTETRVAGPRQDGPPAPRESRAAWPTVMLVWLAGALMVLLRTALAHAGLIRWVRKSRTDLSPAWAATLRRAVIESGIRRPLRVLESDYATSPCTFGVIRPVVLLPAEGTHWPEAQRRFTLLHELAHVRRLDYLTTQVASLACAVHWFNPLIWIAAGQARKLQELACDDSVLNAGSTPSAYAQFLVGLAGGPQRLSPAFPAAVGMVQRTQLHGRVIAILDASRARLPMGRLALAAAFVPLAGVALLLATLSVTATAVAEQSGVALTAPFSAVELRNGGKVHLLHGPAQGVTLLKGDPEQASIAIRDDGRLVIDRCPTECPRNRDFEVTVVTPALAAIAVAEGGAIQVRDGFPPQTEIGVEVSQGGIIDIRTLQVANVAASVYSGGRIFTRPGTALSADVEQGGNVTYWGEAVVRSSVRSGGVVERGSAADLDKSLAELMGPKLAEPVAPIPPVPPVPVVQPADR